MYRTPIFLLVLALLWLLLFIPMGLAPLSHPWNLSTSNCKAIFSVALPLSGINRGDSPYEPLGVLRIVWVWLWEVLASPRHVLQAEIPFLTAFGFNAVDSHTPVLANTPKVSIEWAAYSPPRQTTPAVRVAVYHTHTSETYYNDPRPQDATAHVLPAGKSRGQVVDVGERLVRELNSRGIGAVHDSSVYDTVWSMSYVNARSGVRNLIASYPHLEIILDIHRDGLEHLGREAVSVEVNGRKAARVMFVISEEWGQENLVLAENLAMMMEREYPGLLRRIEIRKWRGYNQDLHPGMLLIEIGGVLNTRVEALYTAELLSDVVYKYLHEKGGL